MLQLTCNTPEELRLIQELHTLDQRLSFNSSRPIEQIPISSTQEYASFANSNQLQNGNPLYPIHSNNIQYFSEIGNHDEDEDSLFAHGIHFLKENRHNGRPTGNQEIENRWNRGKKEEVVSHSGLDNETKNSLKQSKQTKILQILKEQDYIYRKQKSDLPNPKSKKQLPLTNKTLKTQNIKNKPQLTKSSKSVASINNLPPRANKNIQPYENSQHNLRSYLNIQDQSRVSQKRKIIDKRNKQSNQIKVQDSGINMQMLQNYYEQIMTDKQQKGKRSFMVGDSRAKRCNDSKGEVIESNKNSLQCTFKPKILKKSQQMIRSTKNVVERLAISGQQKGNKKPYQPVNKSNSKPSLQRIDQLSRPRKLKTLCPDDEEEVPSFRPSLSKKSLEHMSNCTYDVATRNKLWLEQKEQKLSRLRRQDEEEKQRIEGCSYSPILKPYRGEQQAQFSRFGKEGMVQYFQRLSLMKKRPSAVSFKRDESSILSRDCTEQFLRNNKQNMLKNINHDKFIINQVKSKKQSYEQAVKQLHSKILKLKI